MPVQALNEVREIQNSQAITTKQIVLEVQNCYQVDMDRVLWVLAAAKYGRKSKRELTKTEKEIFCLACSIYSDLEKSFIREYRRRITREELNVYIEILNDTNINLNQRNLATKYRNKLKREITKTSSKIIREKLNTKLRIATISVKVFDDRTSWSRLKNLLVNPILNLDSNTLITPSMIMTLLSYRYPLIEN
ncbi:hypothetical protein H1P_400011 [Hyella patelloides LEGE 07179]|uniref:Uncharacterized protein n=1 Tax=Hyella patelloides LEGE 07179 TaxID=945734 RepID=A0A563VXD0_9CYAN|nr:hypothetical protein [Hyella patelloides]VEP16055.1 hypothetical protein H1P_400011 [Hyella patelloides LEGE 07179]